MKLVFWGTAFAGVILAATPACAGDKPLFKPVPEWVTPAPDVLTKVDRRADNFVPLFDEQSLIDGDTATSYVDAAYFIASAEALNQHGTLTFPWQPDHGDLTIHKVEIIRDGQRIDALAGDPGVTVIRRESGLEQRSINGMLTAVKHVEGLRVGDLLHVSFSVSERDQVLAGNVQDAVLLIPQPVQLGFGRARIVWPQKQALKVSSMLAGVEVAPHAIAGGLSEVVVTLPVTKLPEMPKGIPARFNPAPMIMATSFTSWAQVASVMAPLYGTAGTIEAGSDLAKKVDAIAAQSQDPVTRLAAALQVVQEDVRYQLVTLGTGNYVPQRPADTWSKRYGDCKAKTLLLMAMLDKLGIKAEPVLASLNSGLDPSTMSPAAMAFNHVFVRAEIAGESFWLDGTGLGARLADIRDVPRFGKVLPIRSSGSDLIELPVRADARFGTDADLVMDDSAGPHLPAPFTLKVRYSGMTAARVRVKEDAQMADKLATYGENLAKTWTGSTTVLPATAIYDAKDATWTVTVEGVAYPDWNYSDGRYAMAFKPLVRVTFDPDRSRSAWRQLPALIDDPWTAHSRTTRHLVDGGAKATIEGGDPLDLALPVVTWQRRVSRSGGDLVEDVVTREAGAEVAPNAIGSTRQAINEAMEHEARVVLPTGYPQRWEDVAKRKGSPAFARVRAVFDKRIAAKPDDAVRLDDRAWLADRVFEYKAAEADYTRALAIDTGPDRLIKRARVRSEMGDHPGALKDAQAAFDIDSSNKEARGFLAAELADAGRLDEALDLLPANPDVATEDGQSQALQRVEVLEKGRRHDDALAILDSAIAKRPSVATLRNARCWFQALNDRALDQALADCNKAIELASDPAAYLDSRAMVHFRAGRFTEALADLDGALAIAPEIAPSHFMKGVIYGRQGKASESAVELAIARKLYPDVDAYLGRFGLKP